MTERNQPELMPTWATDPGSTLNRERGVTEGLNMDPASVLRALRRVLEGEGGKSELASRAADAIRVWGGYRWVGVYEIADQTVSLLGFSGPGAPQYPRFSVTQGLTGAVVASKGTLVSNDVTSDPRYLTAFGNTMAEMVVPVFNSASAVVGTIDVESEFRNAFTQTDVQALERCAAELSSLFGD
jgi:putative methionine-R-sulfoxide reductase with GAF domain